MPVSRNYLLFLLTVVAVLNFLDRVALGLLLEDIKLDLSLTDTQLGFLTGIAFALFYAALGLPIARWADRGNRVTIIALTTTVWSAAVAACGLATNFLQLMAIRVAVAVGEAGCEPPALSLISDRFARSERPRAVSRYMLAWPVALVLGNAAAGWLNEWYGWPATFVILGLPGLAVAIIVRFTLREPRYFHPIEVSQGKAAPQMALKEVLLTLWGNTAYRHLLLCSSLVAFFTYGIMQWQPAFFIRSYHLSTGELGSWMAAVYGFGGFFGTWVGGELASRYAVNNEGLQLRFVAVLLIVCATVMTIVYLVHQQQLAFALLGLNAIMGAAINGPLTAATQTLVPARIRALSFAIMLFFTHLIGMGLGPLVAGALSDALHPLVGEESLRYALVLFCPGYLLAALHSWAAGGSASDVARQIEREAADLDGTESSGASPIKTGIRVAEPMQR